MLFLLQKVYARSHSSQFTGMTELLQPILESKIPGKINFSNLTPLRPLVSRIRNSHISSPEFDKQQVNIDYSNGRSIGSQLSRKALKYVGVACVLLLLLLLLWVMYFCVTCDCIPIANHSGITAKN